MILTVKITRIFTSTHVVRANAPVTSPSILDERTSTIRAVDFPTVRAAPKPFSRDPGSRSSMARWDYDRCTIAMAWDAACSVSAVVRLSVAAESPHPRAPCMWDSRSSRACNDGSRCAR